MITAPARGALSLMTALALAVGLVGCSAADPEPGVDDASATDTAPERAEQKGGADDQEGDPAQPPGQDAVPADQGAALDRYVEQVQTFIPQMLEAGGVYDDLRILAVQPDTLEYEYHYSEHVDPVEGARYFDEMIPQLQSFCDVLFPEMEAAGITVDPKVRYSYYNPDGSLIWSHTFGRP